MRFLHVSILTRTKLIFYTLMESIELTLSIILYAVINYLHRVRRRLSAWTGRSSQVYLDGSRQTWRRKSDYFDVFITLSRCLATKPKRPTSAGSWFRFVMESGLELLHVVFHLVAW